jgi:cell division protein FtsZ
MAVKKALESPLLNDGDIRGAQKALVNISTSKDHEIQIDEIDEILNEIREASRNDIDIILGTSYDETLNEELCLTIVVTGFDGTGFDQNDTVASKKEEKLEIVNLEQAPNLFSVVSDLELETKYNLSAPLEMDNETSYEVLEKEEDQIITMIEKDVLTEEENRKRILNEHSIDLNSPFDLSDLSMTPSMFLESQKSIDSNGFVIPKNSVTDSKID